MTSMLIWFSLTASVTFLSCDLSLFLESNRSSCLLLLYLWVQFFPFSFCSCLHYFIAIITNNNIGCLQCHWLLHSFVGWYVCTFDSMLSHAMLCHTMPRDSNAVFTHTFFHSMSLSLPFTCCNSI